MDAVSIRPERTPGQRVLLAFSKYSAVFRVSVASNLAYIGEVLFRAVIQELSSLIQGPFLRANTNVTPQNELEAVMVGAAEVLRDDGRLGRPPDGWLNDPELIKASTGATNTKKKLLARIERAKELLRS